MYLICDPPHDARPYMALTLILITLSLTPLTPHLTLIRKLGQTQIPTTTIFYSK